MTSSYKKKLIEVAIPLEAINAASSREKSIRHGHPSTLHLWWARRPLAACRAVLFAQLVDDPSSLPEQFPTAEAVETERQRLFQIIEELVIWENSNNEAVLERARAEIRKSCGGDGPPICDPFSGGGSIPLEAQRLGLAAYGSDLNPVAVMVGKAMIELPPKFKDQSPVHPGTKDRNHYRGVEGLAEDIRYYGQWMRERAWERIGYLYPQVDLPKEYGGGKGTVVAWIWARTVPSPDPAFSDVQVPLVRSFQLSDNAWVQPQVDGKDYEFKVRIGNVASSTMPEGTVSRQGGRCLVSNSAMPLAYIRQMARKGKLGQRLMAVVVDGSAGRIFISPNREIETIAFSAKPKWLPDELVTTPSHEVDRLPMYGMTTWGAAFTDRQAIALTTFVDVAKELQSKIAKDFLIDVHDAKLDIVEYSKAIRVYLACAIDRCADAWSTIATWSTNGFIRFTFARQAIAMTWDFAECNVFSTSTGNFLGAVEWVAKAVSELPAVGAGSIVQSDARFAKIPNGACLSTDPPYYDNIGYADLSDFFYVWLKRSVGDIFPEVFSTIVVPKTDELVAMPHRHDNRRDAEGYFLRGMTEAFHNISGQLSNEFPCTIYYAFKQSEVTQDGIASAGWATFLEAIISAGLSVVGTWPVRTERAGRTISVGTNALATSVVLVCRKKELQAEVISRAEFMRALKRELPSAISELQAASIAPADMPQSAIGPGMGVFSRYKAVLESDDSPMSVKAALQLINRELDEYLGGIQGEFDADTRFAITWFEQNGMKAGDYDTANSIARARGISVESVRHAGIVQSAAGKVRILGREEIEATWDPTGDGHLTVWECCQQLIKALENDGETSAAMLLKKIGAEKADAVKDLAYCLYGICEKRSDAKEATSYNALIAVWTELTRQAASIYDTGGDRQTVLDL
jgi:putative DNA methylase